MVLQQMNHQTNARLDSGQNQGSVSGVSDFINLIATWDFFPAVKIRNVWRLSGLKSHYSVETD